MMALDLKLGDRVTMGVGYLKCAYCDEPGSASMTYDPAIEKRVYTRHPTKRGRCLGIGKEVPDHINAEQRLLRGIVVGGQRTGRRVWVCWDGEEEYSSVEILGLHREQKTPLQTFTEGVHDAR